MTKIHKKRIQTPIQGDLTILKVKFMNIAKTISLNIDRSIWCQVRYTMIIMTINKKSNTQLQMHLNLLMNHLKKFKHSEIKMAITILAKKKIVKKLDQIRKY